MLVGGLAQLLAGTKGVPPIIAIEREKERRKRLVKSRTEVRKYWDNPAGFVVDCFTWEKEGPTDQQLEVLDSLYKKKRASVRGPHGLGKTSLASWALLWFANTRDGEDWKAPTTASAWRQLTKYLWPEIHKWSRKLRWDRIGREPYDTRLELQTLSLKLRTGEAFAVASDNPELIEGAHADHILYIFDESKVIPAETFDAVEGAFSGGQIHGRESLALSISTPGPPKGRFFDIQSRKPGYEDWWVRHITLKESIAAGRISQEWASQRARQWGVASAVYKNRVLGEFATSDTDSVIPLEWVELAIERWKEWREQVVFPLTTLTSIGVDVSDGGADASVYALRDGNILVEIRRTHKERTMQVVGRSKGICTRYGGQLIVDVIGVGAGVVGRLREFEELKQRVLPYNGATSVKTTDKSGELGFCNLRSAAYWHMRELLDPESPEPIMLPDDDLLISDLTVLTWKVNSAGKIQVTPKEKVIEDLKRSPDTGDAVVMAFSLEILKQNLGPWEIWGGGMEDEPSNTFVEDQVQSTGMYWPSDFR